MKSAFVEPRNSVNEYAPNAAPSATAATSVSVFAGREKVADAFPASARDAAPAARRRVSCEYCDDLFPRPVKTNKRTCVPGTLMTSSAFPVAPMSASWARTVFVSIAISPVSMARPPFELVEASPRTRTSSLTTPSEIFNVLIP